MSGGKTKKELLLEITVLRLALAQYTDATIVKSWGYQELRDAGQMARHTLGFGDHLKTCCWPDIECDCGLENRVRVQADEWHQEIIKA